MAEITAQLVKQLRDATGAGMMDCKAALAEAGGDMEKAQDVLRKKGLKDAGKRSAKVAAEGIVFSYIHPGDRVGVILELNCETDFVARGEEFAALAKRIAMHIAWAAPKYLDSSEVPEEAVAREKDIFLSQLSEKQKGHAENIIKGKLEKFFEENCLLQQIDAQEASAKAKVADVVQALSAKLGEKIEIRRYQRFEVGEGIEKQEVNYAEEVAQAAGLQ